MLLTHIAVAGGGLPSLPTGVKELRAMFLAWWPAWVGVSLLAPAPQSSASSDAPGSRLVAV